MSSPGDGERSQPSEVVAEVLANPAEGERRLPTLLGLLDDDEVSVRLAASSALCAVARAQPDTVEYLARRLSHRVDDTGDALEAEQALEYLAGAYPERVDAVLEDLEEEFRERRRARAASGFPRTDYVGRRPASLTHGRTRLPKPSGDDPRQVYLDRGAGGPAGGERERSGAPEQTDEEEPEESEDRDRMSGPNRALSTIIEESRFDSLSIVAPGRRDRYSDIFRTRAVEDGEELGVGLRLFHMPTDATRRDYVDAMVERIERWREVDDDPHVVSVHDWGYHPRLWVATEYAERTLEGRELGVAEAVWNARKLGETLAGVHQQGLVHGGLDPGNVVYTGTELTERLAPLLDNVGLMGAFRRHFDPSLGLDPRYAAPEYFDDRYGSVDHLTDVYQLGAVVYRLLAGRAPFRGEYEAVREGVLEGTPPPPSQVADVPPALDEVVSKAMARGKLTRYESVANLVRELVAASGGAG